MFGWDFRVLCMMPFSPCFEPSRNKCRKETEIKIIAYLQIMLGFGPHGRLKAKAGFLCLQQNGATHSQMDLQIPIGPPCKTTLRKGCQTSTSERPHWKAKGLPPGHFSRTLANRSSPLPPTGSSSFQVGHVLVNVFIFFSFSFFFLSCLTLLVSRQPSDTSVIYIFPPCLMSYFPVILLNRVEKASTVKSA